MTMLPILARLCLGSLLAAEPAQDVQAFQAALAAYDAGHFAEAAAGFDRLQQAGLPSGWLAYNLGNSALKADRLGEAIAAYRRALVDLPRQGDVRANLAFARRRVPDAVAPAEPAPLWRSVFFWHYVCNRREAAWALSLLCGLRFALAVPPLWGRQMRLYRNLGALCTVAALAVAVSLGVHAWAPAELGIVLSNEVDVRTVNEPGAPVRFRLHAGAEAWVQTALDGWLLLALSDGKQGWVPQQTMARIAL
jgi:tetratricopeptide (TPR) repeat protein